MQTLSNGYKLPETGDFGDEWFPALEDNITRVNGHSHNGTDSEKLSSDSIEALTDTIASGSFGVDGSRFSATITLLSGMEVDSTQISFRDPTTKNPIALEYEKFSVTQIKVFAHFVQNIEVVYA